MLCGVGFSTVYAFEFRDSVEEVLRVLVAPLRWQRPFVSQAHFTADLLWTRSATALFEEFRDYPEARVTQCAVSSNCGPHNTGSAVYSHEAQQSELLHRVVILSQLPSGI